MEQTHKYCYHKIPLVSSLETKVTTATKKDPIFVGIIDSSGSMSSAWTHVANNYNLLIDDLSTPNKITFCFDTGIHNVPNNKLQQNINAHGGGGTDIYKPMQKLDTIIEEADDDVEIKVVFVSDGQDNSNYSSLTSKLASLKGSRTKNVTFMCLGVQSGFPTQTSMSLRELFHRGDSSIPSIFLIEYSSDKAFFNKFKSLKKFCMVKEILKVEPPQKLFPWEAPVGKIVENTWILSKDKTITVNGNKITYEEEDFSVESICDIFRSWSQKLQLDSMNKKVTFAQAKEFASSCVGLMEEICEDVKNWRGIDIKSNQTKEGSDFLTRVLNLQVVRTSQKINGYITAVEDIKNGKDLTQLNEYEAAKIIGLGTIVGKAQQRALALKYITRERLQEFVVEFLKALDEVKIQEETDFVEAHMSEGNYHKLFSDESFRAGLKKLESPLDFLDVFPIYGAGLVVKRPDGSNTDASKVATSNYSKTATLDSSTFDFATYKLEVQEGEENIGFNCVCPLLGPKDHYLAPLFETNLMKYALSFNVTQELDAVNDSSWLVILGDLFIHAMKKDDFETVEKVASTLQALKEDKEFKMIYEGVEANDSSIYSKFKSEGLFYATMYAISQEGELDSEEKDEIVQKIWIRYFGERLTNDSITSFIQTESAKNLKVGIMAKYTPQVLCDKFYTSREVVRHIKNNFHQELDEVAGEQQSTGLALLPSGFTSDVNKFISYAFLKKLALKINGSKLDDNKTFLYLGHCVKHHQNSLNEPLSEDINEAKVELASNFQSGQDIKLKKRIIFQCMDEMKRAYFKKFKQIHWNIQPMEKEEVIAACEERGIDFDELDYNEESKMVRNACMARDCEHFLVPKSKKKLRNHMGGWQGLCPRAFHLYIAENNSKLNEEIYEGFLEVREIKDIDAYGVSKEKVLEYIESVKAKY